MTIQNKQNLSLGTNYEQVAGKFRPIFQRIAEGALAREKNRELPREPIQWLKEAGFGAVRVPTAFGGDSVSQKPGHYRGNHAGVSVGGNGGQCAAVS